MKPYYETKLGKLYCGDCLEIMPELEENSIDMVLCDPPYGTTACSWDSVIPLELMWLQLMIVIKDKIAIILTASQPFTTVLIASNMDLFKYCWVWEKTIAANFMNAKNKPLQKHEDVVVFSSGTVANCSDRRMPYFPQGLKETNRKWSRPKKYPSEHKMHRESHKLNRVIKYSNYPSSVQKFHNGNNKSVHPTQKPVALMRFLIQTYTNKGDIVLDFTLGSGTTAVACEELKRKWIGIEISEKYCEIAAKRIEKENQQLRLF